MIKQGLTYTTNQNPNVVWGAEGTPNQYGSRLYYGLDRDGSIAYWIDDASMGSTASAGTGFNGDVLTNCQETGAGKPISCTFNLSLHTVSSGHKP